MNIAVLSDIHGNYIALEAVLRYIDEYEARRGRRIDHIVFLGDYVTDGPFTEKTMDLVYETIEKYPCTCIRGNREEYLLEYENTPHPWKKCSGTGLLMYTYEHLREKDWTFFNSLDNHGMLELEGIEPITIVHGSQFKTRDNYYEHPSDGDRFLRKTDTRLILGGHSHTQHVVERYGKTYVNPGSIGESQDGIGGHAQFCVITYDEVEGNYDDDLIENDSTYAKRFGIENYTIPYDIDRYIRELHDTEVFDYGFYLPRLMELFVKTGVNYFFKGVTKAAKISGVSPAETSEEIWAAVYEEMKEKADRIGK